MSPAFKKIKEFFSILGIDERRCAHCLAPYTPKKVPSGPSSLLCEACVQELAPFSECACSTCGRPVTPNSIGYDGKPQCDDCYWDPPPWDAASFYGIYKDSLKDLVLRLKFDGDLAIADLFSDFLFYVCKNLPRPDLILPVPQFPSQTRKRGYNQANEIARSFAKKCGLAYRNDILLRVKPGDPQEALNAVRRKQNLKDAFACRESLSGKSVWLIDDVFTTGSTCRESVAALRKAGASETRIVFIGRANS